MGGAQNEADAGVHEAAGSGNGCDERSTGTAGGNAKEEMRTAIKSPDNKRKKN